jgi:hypothetical protein
MGKQKEKMEQRCFLYILLPQLRRGVEALAMSRQ